MHRHFSRGSYRTLTGEPDSGEMTAPGHDAGTRAHAASARDAALARVVHARRWVILGSAGLSAGFAALVSASPPSSASTTSAKGTVAPPATRSSSSSQAPSLPPLPNGSALGLQGPSQAPQGDDSQSAQSAPSQPAQSAPPSQSAPSPQPGPVSGGS